MKCVRCRDERVIWTRDTFGFAVCQPCPICNKHGQAVQKEFELFKDQVKSSAAKTNKKE
ncbi:hypothetical protein [Enterococcus raffinosus]|uniref:hypothetical protein n=1 Tax=Enterococcus raffinosus TaxID=71452 RepID=UPI000399CACE|nr:hypothetical protein [Enterococcus raffinosus]UXK04508.1 hypothetical protein N7K38_01710 [Enterococcus raffinosus]HDU2614975.1 hypothetical protein [Enterococcus faecalis]